LALIRHGLVTLVDRTLSERYVWRRKSGQWTGRWI